MGVMVGEYGVWEWFDFGELCGFEVEGLLCEVYGFDVVVYVVV